MSETRIPGACRIGVRALSSFVLLGMLGCSSVDEDPGALRGRFVESIARFPDGRSQSTYFLAQGKERSNRQKLVFDEAPDIFPNTEIKVWGTKVDGRFEVERFEVVGDAPVKGPLGKSQQALIDAAPIEPTNMVMVAVDTGAGFEEPDIVAELNRQLFDEADPTSLIHYYLENSFGMHSLTGMVAPTPYTYAMDGCDYDALTDAVVDQVHADTGVPEFDLYLWYFPQTDSCSWSGLSSGEDTYYNGSYGCVVLAQEPGHSFGLAHSSSLECTDASGAVVSFADDPQASCVHSEYGNRYDSMGGGCRHFSGYQKVYRTYLQGCNVAQVSGSGTFTLHPIESPCNGVQVIQVPMARPRAYDSEGGGSGDRTTNLAYYNVELRAPIGAFDGGQSPMVPSVLINAAPDWRIFGQGGGGRGMSRGEHIWLLDMAPTVTDGGGRGGGSRNGAAHALAVGQTFTDPAGGVTITTEAVSATSATIRVNISGAAGAGGTAGGAGAGGAGGGPMMAPGTIATCLDDTPLVAPGPVDCGGNFAGMAGMAGVGGLAGSGGLAGGGAGGAGGIAGSGPLGGTAGAMSGAGMPGRGTAGRGQVITPDSELEGGCGCRVLGDRGSSGRTTGALALLGILAAALGRRRRVILPRWL
jgi:MYXO-CTERM domain-containing protein